MKCEDQPGVVGTRETADCEQAPNVDQICGRTGVEALPGLKRHFTMRIVSLSHFRMVNIGRRSPVNPQRRFTASALIGPSTG
jgi:hypothetical protein